MKTPDIELNACNVIVDTIKRKGYCQVANSANCIEKVKRRLGIELVDSHGYGVLRFKDECICVNRNIPYNFCSSENCKNKIQVC